MLKEIYQRVRGAFLAGLLVVIPAGITIWVFVALVRFLEGAIKLVPEPWRPENLIGVAIPGLGVLLAITTVLFMGLMARSVGGRAVINAYEYVLLKVPVLSSVYQGVKQLLEALFSTDKDYFQQVVIVEWPRPGLYALAFYTGQSFLQAEGKPRMVNLFMPTTPNPTTGYFIMLPEDQVITTDLTVEQGFKLLMSAGHRRAPGAGHRRPRRHAPLRAGNRRGAAPPGAHPLGPRNRVHGARAATRPDT